MPAARRPRVRSVPARLVALLPVAALVLTGAAAAPGPPGPVPVAGPVTPASTGPVTPASTGPADPASATPVSAAPGPASPAMPGTPARWEPGPADAYVNHADARIAPAPGDAGDPRARDGEERARDGEERARRHDARHAEGNPVAAARLARLERDAIRTGRSPAALTGRAPGDGPRRAKLLTLLVEFDPAARDDFSGFRRPASVTDPACVTEPPGTFLSGPAHNRIPDPALADRPDNNSLWVPDFSPGHYERMLYSAEGLTERVRPDLTGPDGRPGVDLSGRTMRNLYDEMSGGRYLVEGTVAGWLTVPHSQAWYAAARCGSPRQDNAGHPANPLGVQQLVVDAIAELARTRPDFPWADHDREDIGDADRDGNVDEPDGVIDHLVLVHAGKDKSAGGGAEGTYAIWAHASTVLYGHPVPGTDLKVANYIVQPEDAGVGVFAHEYGHDLGLPDLYDNFSGGSTDVDFWDLMASGSHAGPLFQTLPVHLGAWGKYVLGWLDPVVVPAGAGTPLTPTLGRAALGPPGTARAVRVDLPRGRVNLGTPHSGSSMWFSEYDQEWADVRLTRRFDVPAGRDVRLWMWNDYVVEKDWDFGFVEVSADGGLTWRQLEVRAADGTLVTTPDDYADPERNLAAFRKFRGLTGSSGGWRHDQVDLTPYAGTTVDIRLTQMTDAAFQERGWFVDDFELVADGVTVWRDGAEDGDGGWTATTGTVTTTRGQGWGRTGGTFLKDRYYLLEWRAPAGFDEGLHAAYTTEYATGSAVKVNRLRYNAPGLLVWLRDAAYSSNGTRFHLTAGPSYGAKAALLLVDAHPDPVVYTGAAAEHLNSTANPFGNVENRAQSADAAFAPAGTWPFRACHTGGAWCQDFGSLPGVREFTDALGWTAGVRYLDGKPRDRLTDGSVVVPAPGPYSTRVVLADGSPDIARYGVPYGGSVLGTGNPADAGHRYGVTVTVVAVLPGDEGAVVRVTPSRAQP